MKIDKQDGQLVYTKFDGGDSILLAFHGFGQDKSIFKAWSDLLKDKYTIYAFDIFYHGNSNRVLKNLSKIEWNKYLTEFLIKEDIQKFDVLGFSLGGRFAIASSIMNPKKVKQLILIAPDGIFLTIWFKMATNPMIRWLFKYFMMNPDKLQSLISINDRYKLVSQYLGEFANKELSNPENGKRVYHSWNHFKTLGYTKRQLIKLFNQYDFKRRIILGKKDHIIKPEQILPTINAMGAFNIDVLPMKHHQLVKPEVAKLILNTNK